MFYSICVNQAYCRQCCPVLFFSKLLQNVPNKLPINDNFLHILYNSSFKSPFHFILRELGSCNINRLCLPKNSSIVIWRRGARCHQFVRRQCLEYVAGGGWRVRGGGWGWWWRMGREIFLA